jgi:hypothetical protein
MPETITNEVPCINIALNHFRAVPTCPALSHQKGVPPKANLCPISIFHLYIFTCGDDAMIHIYQISFGLYI